VQESGLNKQKKQRSAAARRTGVRGVMTEAELIDHVGTSPKVQVMSRSRCAAVTSSGTDATKTSPHTCRCEQLLEATPGEEKPTSSASV
jgi:hypothetical protein